MNEEAVMNAVGTAAATAVFALVGIILYVVGLIVSAIYCACNAPKDDRVAWLLVVIFVPLGWIAYWMWGPSSVTSTSSVHGMPLQPSNPTERDIAASVVAGLQAERARKR